MADSTAATDFVILDFQGMHKGHSVQAILLLMKPMSIGG